MGCDSCKQFGGKKGGAMPLSYLNKGYQEPSAPAGSDRLISEPLLARPSLNHTGGKRRKHSKCTRKHRHTRKCRNSRKGGFYPSIMGGLINNGSRLLPAAGIQAYRMVRNYNKSRKNRK
ncbi:MAG: hypothetical protein EBU66_11645 [Bacteroidetes bacterium]|jgi:hypothetical protein|nr:hypothetical protein [bacterium]NBP65295.1 hypothetical protein [Bacteroidota bacterium]